MATQILICLLGFAGFGLALPTQVDGDKVQKTTSEIYKLASDAVVRVEVLDGAGKLQKSGSGFFISDDGQLVTNHHVIEGASAALVKLTSGGTLPVLGVLADNPDRDLAILKVAGSKLPHLEIGSSSSVEVGMKVIAIGSPLGLQNSVSEGIVSGVREIGNTTWIQTTAPASPGNSGGPLINDKGIVVAVVTAKLVGAENLNFAIPISAAVTLGRIETLVPLTDMKSLASTSASGSQTWTSMTTGRDFRVRVDGDYIYAEWVNLPSILSGTMAFMRSELKREGSEWKGTARSYLPYKYFGNQVKWCSLEMPIEITSLTSTRIEGTSTGGKKIDVRHCRIEQPQEEKFAWIPKE